MKTKLFFIVFLCLGISARSQSLISKKDLTDYVNPLMGTDSEYKLSSGNTYPAVALPWGMNFWTPQTAQMGDGWVYAYDAYEIRGFKQTHQPSPWINDYGQFSIMPVTGSLKFKQDERKSWFSHKTEDAKPYKYKVYLADYDIWTEMAPTDRSASFEITYPQNDSSFIVIDAFDGGSYIKILPSEKKIIGYTTKNSGGVPKNFKNYFILEFDKAFDQVYTWNEGKLSPEIEKNGNHVGAVVRFKTSKGEKVRIKVSSSFIDFDQAQLNLQREIGNKTHSEIVNSAKQVWENELSKIKVEGADERTFRTFYSCLYRLLLFPRKFYEFDKNNQIIHYSPYNGEVLPGYMFTDNGFWDTFRAVFPFFTLMYPELDQQIMQGLVNTCKESGWLPEWASPGHRDCMIGSNSASIIADAYLKGIRGFDIETLYTYILKNSENEGPLASVGRKGVKYYNQYGYIPYDVKINENTARTLEYAYDDYTIYKLAKALNKSGDEIKKFATRAENYKNVFDISTKFMRGRNLDGKFQTPFNPYKWGDAFTEGNSWHYTWSVFHDVRGLIDLMGGNNAFCNKLDSMFTLPPHFDESYYGQVIHEIREMQIMGMGQYAHGNQPVQHALYLYNYAGMPWKTQFRVREVMKKLYSPDADGYCGDEDNGQTSAWFVFSAMGFYPVCPGQPMYVLGSPLFKKITLKLPGGKEFSVSAQNNDESNVYIKSLKLNGKEYNKNYINHTDLTKGGKLDLIMDKIPQINRGTDKSAFPPSLSEEKKTDVLLK